MASAGYNDLPTFSNRTVSSDCDCATAKPRSLAGLITDRESTSLSGLPGLADIPLLGRLFGRNQKDALETDIIMTITPRILFKPELTESDLKSFSVGSESSPLLFKVPPSRQPVSPPAPVLLPTPMLPPEPIRPPVPVPTPTPEPQR